MKRVRNKSPLRLGRDAERLITLSTGLAVSGSRAEDRVWEAEISALVVKAIEASNDPTLESALDRISIPAEILRDINIVDTPGTNAIHREHEAITREFVPRADMVLFVTSADRPFTETERAFLEQVRGWGKKVLVVINKIDILEGERQIDEVGVEQRQQ